MQLVIKVSAAVLFKYLNIDLLIKIDLSVFGWE